MSDKIISINTEALKDKATSLAKSAASATRERISSATSLISEKTKDAREKALDKVLSRGIAISEKQLKALKQAKSKLS
ncbi:MAG: hypothetical protein FJ146_06770 [Deltaproteobacteria bacterium]|nr:hypothetical protein [Deltaproteobacteria bacterium]